MQYTEFKETNMILQDRILTYSEEAAIKAEKRAFARAEKQFRKEEREKVRKEKLQIARNLKQIGLADAQIASATGLSPEDIQRA
jgi:predicted transposase YdaD